nr:amino acid--tRNA ligase-related protein [Treponema brennaborense]
MDLEMLQFRARIMQKIRTFFIERGYLELDTPALSRDLIPETCLEVFRTDYIEPWSGGTQPLYLVPSPEIYMKKIIARHAVSVFQLSKCYRNVESTGRIHSPEFTMLEYYTMNADYAVSAAVTEDLFTALLPAPEPAAADGTVRDPYSPLRPPFIRLTMDDAFKAYAGFRLSDCPEAADLADRAAKLGIAEPAEHPFREWPWDDLYELLLVQCVEPALPREKPVFLTDYPAKVPCLAKDVTDAVHGSPSEQDSGRTPLWKERWELYAQGIELANCYTEETDPDKVKAYFETEGKLKQNTARVPHAIDPDYWKIFRKFPACSGSALGVDRLIALLAGCSSIDSVLPFPLEQVRH